MNTVTRLEGYFPFAPEIIDHVGEVAERQAVMSHSEFMASVGAHEVKPFSPDGRTIIEVLDILPENADPKAAMMIHLAMANPLDANQRYQIATVAAANADRRIIATGNPSAFGYASGVLNRRQRRLVALGDFRPTVEALLKYTEQEKIERVDQIGYSYGVDKAVAVARYDAFEVPHTVAIEPASVVQRGVMKLGLTFGSTAKALKGYVNANELPAFLAAREESIGGMEYNSGLLRLTNIATARGIAKGGFEMDLDEAMVVQDSMKTILAWGSESELAPDNVMVRLAQTFADNYGPHRVEAIRLPGQKHALANDVHLQAAIVAHALR
jgi:hypothetical protein